ncbi:unnamed protein product [Effrenium voratum]|nr:unnamed protein product [Effrenium voratum]
MDSLQGAGMWASAVLGPDGFTYCLPCNARQVLRLSETGASELVGADFGEETWKWTAAVLGPKGTIWGIPGNAERVVCLNPSGHMELVGPVLEGTHKWHCAVLAPDGCIYAPPCDAGQVLRIDCARRHVALIGPLLGGVGKYCACAATQSHVYCPPNHARQVLSICLATKQVELIGPDLSFGGGGAYVSAVCGLDGVVHCPPFGAPRALRIAEDGVELYGPELPWMAHKWRAALLAPDGCVYAAPCNAGRVLRSLG